MYRRKVMDKQIKLAAEVVDNTVVVILDCDTPEAIALIAASIRAVSDRAKIQVKDVVDCIANTMLSMNEENIKSTDIQ